MSSEAWFRQHALDLSSALAQLGSDAGVVESWGRRLAALLPGGGRLLVAGNGGSAAEAQHLTAELVGRYVDERQPLSALALHAETSSLTAILNDYGADEVFARQVQAHGRRGDVLLLLSTSGRSPNVLQAAERGHQMGLTVWAMTGRHPNPLAQLADEVLAIDAGSTSLIQELHLVAVHALCAAVDAHLLPATAGVPAPPALPTSHVSQAWRRFPRRTPHVERQQAEQSPGGTVGGRGPGSGGSGGGSHIVVVGDVLLDRDIDGHTDRVSPDAPVPVVDVDQIRESPGGAGLTALLCAASGGQVTLVAPFADDESGARLGQQLSRAGIDVVPLGQAGATRRKTRVRSGGQSLLRLDDGGPANPERVPLAELCELLTRADVVLVSDYGGGTTHHVGLRQLLAETARRTTLVWDPHPNGGEPVPAAALVTPNFGEALKACGAADSPVGHRHPDEMASTLCRRWQARGVCVTAGAQGAFLALSGNEPLFVPAPTVAGGDPCGAGDRFVAAVASELAGGAVLSEAVTAAVAAASAWVGAGGADAFRRASWAAASPVDAEPCREAAGPVRTAEEVVAQTQARGGAVVATGGCFDILHSGHVACLESARRLGDALVVLLNSDDSVRRLKGPGRPAVGAEDRARVLSALTCVDAVLVFDEDDPRAVLDQLRPDVWAKGGDYGATPLAEAELVRSWGGRVVLLPYVDGRSTTAILGRTRPEVVARPESR